MLHSSLADAAGGAWRLLAFAEKDKLVTIYPRLAAAGMLTLVPTGTRSSLLLMDIEYVTWANPKSELVIFPSGSSCCGPGPVVVDVATGDHASGVTESDAAPQLVAADV